MTVSPTFDLVPPVDDVTRREFVVGGIALVALGAALASCGEDDDTSSDATIDFVFEDVNATVPAEPKRVVVMEGRGDLDAALALGYEIVATGNPFDPTSMPGADGGLFAGLLPDGIQLLQVPDFAPNFEQLVSLEPDLIIMRANAWRLDFFGSAQVASIAPVLAIETNRNDRWRQDLQEQAQILGRAARLAPLLEEYDDALAAAREEIASRIAGRTIAMMVVGSDGAYIWTDSIAMYTGRDLGMELPFLESAAIDPNTPISPELLPDFLGDIDLIYRQATTESDAAALDALAVWQQLPAVQAGRVQELSHTLNNAGPHAVTALVAALVEGTRSLG